VELSLGNMWVDGRAVPWRAEADVHLYNLRMQPLFGYPPPDRPGLKWVRLPVRELGSHELLCLISASGAAPRIQFLEIDGSVIVLWGWQLRRTSCEKIHGRNTVLLDANQSTATLSQFWCQEEEAMLETLSALKTCQDLSFRREMARKHIIKLRWIGQEEKAVKLSEEIAHFMPELTIADRYETD
jgi:hypothetical protein